MSLQVKINSKAVRLPEGFELAINLKNNLLDGDREDATYPMEVNLASNRQVFGFVDRTHMDMTEKLQAGVSFGPYQLLNGQCVLTDVGDGNVEFYISTEKNSFWGKARDRMLDESCWGQFTYSPGNRTNTLEQFYKSLKERMVTWFALFEIIYKEFVGYRKWIFIITWNRERNILVRVTR